VVPTSLGDGAIEKNLEISKLLADKAAINRRRADGSTPLSIATLHGQLDIARRLIENGAEVSGANSDGNTPLHVAAFLCRGELQAVFNDLGKGASCGASKTHWDKLMPKVHGGGAGCCPLLLIGMGVACYASTA